MFRAAKLCGSALPWLAALLVSGKRGCQRAAPHVWAGQRHGYLINTTKVPGRKSSKDIDPKTAKIRHGRTSARLFTQFVQLNIDKTTATESLPHET